MSREIEIEKLTIGEKLTTQDVDTTDIKINGVSIKGALAKLPEKWVNTVNGQVPDDSGDVKVIAKSTYIPDLGIAFNDEANEDTKDYLVLGSYNQGVFVADLEDKTAFRPNQSLTVTSNGKDINIPFGYGRLHSYCIGKGTDGNPLYAMTNHTKNRIETSRDMRSWTTVKYSSNNDSLILESNIAYGANPYTNGESFFLFNGRFKHTAGDDSNSNNLYLTKDFTAFECFHISTDPTSLRSGPVFYVDGKFFMHKIYSKDVYEVKITPATGGGHTCELVLVASLPGTHDADINTGNSTAYRIAVDAQSNSAFFGVNGQKRAGGSLAVNPYALYRFWKGADGQYHFDYAQTDFDVDWVFPKECRGGVTRFGDKLYVGTREGHIYESADGGATWKFITQVIINEHPVEIVKLFTYNNELYVAGSERGGFWQAVVGKIEFIGGNASIKFIELNLLSTLIMDI